MLTSSDLEKMSTVNMSVLSYLPRPTTVDRRWKPNVEIAPNCPRCDSSNTKFCYYNNYSLTQPRYFCKGCRRYWTKGGSLRNVPVGGGCRKNRRGKVLRTNDRNSLRQRELQGDSSPPDILVDNSQTGKNSNTTATAAGPLSSSSNKSNPDASVIDLAALYAKFSNQRPEFESSTAGLLTDRASDDRQLFPVENYNRVEFTTTLNSDYQSTPIACSVDSQIQSLTTNGEVQHQLGGSFPQSELDFSFNNTAGVTCGSSQYLIDEGLSSISTDLFWHAGCSPTTISNSLWQQTAFHNQFGFVPPLEDSLYQNLTNTNWNMFEYSSSFEARS